MSAMIDLGSLFSLYGDLVQLNFPSLQGELSEVLPKYDIHWKPYNPRKLDNPRFGLSLTSLDGKMSGVPDLDSLKEINKIHNKNYREKDFNKVTDLANSLSGLSYIFKEVESYGRSHLIKLNKGGHFPPHRDGGVVWPPSTLRVFSPLFNCETNQFVWLQNGVQLPFKQGNWYLINTSKEHSVFSFTDECIFLVVNIPATQKNLEFFLSRLAIS